MTRTIMPAFERYPKEAALVGKLLSGYGELEYTLAWAVRWIINDADVAFRWLYKSRGESQRISTAESLTFAAVRGRKHEGLWREALDNLKHCLKIRNQYAHATWVDHLKELMFVDLEDIVHQPGPIDPSALKQKAVRVHSLQKQEAYFCHVADQMTFVCYEFQVEDGSRPNHPWPVPGTVARPNL
jgi:hypothetical protein